MKVSLIKHLKTINSTDLKSGCADGQHHLVVIGIESSDASFHVFYKNQDTPYKVKQISGCNRGITDLEFEASNNECHEILLSSIEEALSQVAIYQEIAKLIDTHAGSIDRKHHLLAAVKIHKSDNYNEMHYHLSNMIKAKESVIENIINAACDMMHAGHFMRYN